MAKYPTSSWRAREALLDREAYTTGGAMHAESGWRPLPFNTQLPTPWRALYWESSDDITYVVWSYHTPIGWVLRNGDVIVPDVKYSRTTTQHQGMLYALKYKSGDPGTVGERAAIRAAAQRERDGVRNRRHAAEDRAAAQRVAYRIPAAPRPVVQAEDCPARSLVREQVAAELAAERASAQADVEDRRRQDLEALAGEPRPQSWEAGWEAPRPYATTDGALYSDEYLFRRQPAARQQ